MLLKWLWCGMMGWYPPLNDLSDSTWHMFTHVVETNQHSLHDIYVHGGLYRTHSYIRCKLIFFSCLRLLSLSQLVASQSFASLHLYQAGILLVHPNSLNPKVVPYESTIPSYMWYLPAVPSKFVCAKLQTFKWNSVLYARIAHVSTRDVCISHARQVILKRSGLRSSFTRKWLVTGMPSPMLKLK